MIGRGIIITIAAIIVVAWMDVDHHLEGSSHFLGRKGLTGAGPAGSGRSRRAYWADTSVSHVALKKARPLGLSPNLSCALNVFQSALRHTRHTTHTTHDHE
jgi:hypothetical protein